MSDDPNIWETSWTPPPPPQEVCDWIYARWGSVPVPLDELVSRVRNANRLLTEPGVPDSVRHWLAARERSFVRWEEAAPLRPLELATTTSAVRMFGSPWINYEDIPRYLVYSTPEPDFRDRTLYRTERWEVAYRQAIGDRDMDRCRRLASAFFEWREQRRVGDNMLALSIDPDIESKL